MNFHPAADVTWRTEHITDYVTNFYDKFSNQRLLVVRFVNGEQDALGDHAYVAWPEERVTFFWFLVAMEDWNAVEYWNERFRYIDRQNELDDLAIREAFEAKKESVRGKMFWDNEIFDYTGAKA